MIGSLARLPASLPTRSHCKQRAERPAFCRCTCSHSHAVKPRPAALQRRDALRLLAAVVLLAPAAAANAGTTQGDYKTASSGLQWLDTKEGSGKSPVKGATIKCHYTGRLESGSVFDSSYERRRPLSFKIGVGQVIKGWDAGILGADDIPAMKEGGKRSLIIPASLGYGARGAGGVIPPNAQLFFDVELVKA